MDGECYHLRDGGEAGDWPVVGGVFSVASFEDQDRASFEEPVVLLDPTVSDLPFHHLLHELEDSLLNGWALLDGKGEDAIYPARRPWGSASKNFFKLFFCELEPPASSSPYFIFHSVEDPSDVSVIFPPFAVLLLLTLLQNGSVSSVSGVSSADFPKNETKNRKRL